MHPCPPRREDELVPFFGILLLVRVAYPDDARPRERQFAILRRAGREIGRIELVRRHDVEAVDRERGVDGPRLEHDPDAVGERRDLQRRDDREVEPQAFLLRVEDDEGQQRADVTSTPTRILSSPWPPIASKYGGGYQTSSMTVTTVAAISADKPRWIAAAFQRLRDVSSHRASERIRRVREFYRDSEIHFEAAWRRTRTPPAARARR